MNNDVFLLFTTQRANEVLGQGNIFMKSMCQEILSTCGNCAKWLGGAWLRAGGCNVRHSRARVHGCGVLGIAWLLGGMHGLAGERATGRTIGGMHGCGQCMYAGLRTQPQCNSGCMGGQYDQWLQYVGSKACRITMTKDSTSELQSGSRYTSYMECILLYTKASDFAQFSITHILSVMEIITGVVVEIITGVNNNTVMSPMTAMTMIVVTYSL